jgi:hypothetical protein
MAALQGRALAVVVRRCDFFVGGRAELLGTGGASKLARHWL